MLMIVHGKNEMGSEWDGMGGDAEQIEIAIKM